MKRLLSSRAFKKVLRVIFRQKLLLSGQLAFMVVSIALMSLSPWPYKLLVDNVLGNELIDTGTVIGRMINALPSQEYLGFIVVFLFFLTSVVSNLVEYFQSVNASRLTQKVIFGFSREAFAEFEASSMQSYRSHNIGDYVYRLTVDTAASGNFLQFGVIPFISSTVSLVVIIWILFSIDVRLTFISMWILPFIASLFRYLNRQISRETRRSEKKYSSLYSFVEQALSQLKSIQAYQQEKRGLSDYSQKLGESLRSDYRVDVYNLLINLSTGAFIGIGYAVIVAIGISMVKNGELTAGLLIVFIFYIDNLTGPMLYLVDAITALKRNIIRIVHLDPVFAKSHQLKDTGRVTAPPRGVIRFDGVSFSGTKGEKVIDRATFQIPEKGITAVIGRSGSGKTTLMSMIPRFVEPSRGTITIGKHHLTEYTLKTLRSAVAFVSQESALFDGTIRSTIAFGRTHVSDEEIRQAAREAAAHDFIMKHPGNYDFRVGDQGNLLSGGQKQRLLLARGYLKKAPIFILDEIFSAQDPYTKSLMLKSLRTYAGRCTVIMITNILDVIRDEDMAVVVDAGRIIYTGLFGELKNQKGELKKLLGEIEKEGGE